MIAELQEPRVCWSPEYVASSGREAVELAAVAGLHLDPWQQLVLERALGELPNGKWAAFEVGLVLPRQNGKDAILEARELAGLFLLGEQLLIHSAHQFDTSLEHFRRLLDLIEGCADMSRRVKRVSRSHGEEGIELHGPAGRRVSGGQRIRFRTRTKGGGRGFSGDFLALNEAMELPEATVGALLPTLSARPNPQVWYVGSPVDQVIHENGIVLSKVRARGVRGDDPSLAYFEWSVDRATPADVEPDVAADEREWVAANPALGIRISASHIRNEHLSLDARTFAVERLGVGDWPATDGTSKSVFNVLDWRELIDVDSEALDPVCVVFDVNPSRSWATIGAAGVREDGLGHVEVIDRRAGTGWLVDRLVEVVERNDVARVLCDAASPAASLVPALEARGLEVEMLTAKEYAAACGVFYDAVDQATVRHLGTQELDVAVKAATKRPLGDAWAWSRKSGVDISPLVACSVAFWASATLVTDGEALVAWA